MITNLLMEEKRLDPEAAQILQDIKETAGIKTNKKALGFVLREFQTLQEQNQELINRVQVLKLKLKMGHFK